MRSKTRRIAAGAALALAVTAAAPSALASDTAAAIAPCRASASALNGNQITVVVTGHYVDNQGGDVTLTCHVVQNGQRRASFTDSSSGPIAVVSGTASVPIAPFSVCYEVSIWDITGWGYRYQTNC
jgi:hypothetical protein